MALEHRLSLVVLVCCGMFNFACASGEMVGSPGGGGGGGSNSTGNGGRGGSSSTTGGGGTSSNGGGGGSTFTGNGGQGGSTTGTGGTTSTTGSGGTTSTTGSGGVSGFVMMCKPAAPLISDMEDGHFYYNDGGCPDGSWYLATAGGGTATADPAFVAPSGSVTPVAVSPANAMNSASTKAIHISGSGQMNSAAGVYDAYVSLSASLNQPSSTQAGSVDATSYQGVKFWGKISGPVRLQVSNLSTDQDAVPKTCTTCSDHFGATLTASTAWTLYQIPFSTMMQEGFGVPKLSAFSAAGAMKVLWKVLIPGTATTNPPVGAWDIWIDDVSFY